MGKIIEFPSGKQATHPPQVTQPLADQTTQAPVEAAPTPHSGSAVEVNNGNPETGISDLEKWRRSEFLTRANEAMKELLADRSKRESLGLKSNLEVILMSEEQRLQYFYEIGTKALEVTGKKCTT